MPGIHWSEVLPEVLAGMHLLPTRVGLSPFMLLYKQAPRWPLGEGAMIGVDDVDLPEECTDDEWWTQVLRQWDAVLTLACERMAAGDSAMVQAYKAGIAPAAPDTRTQYAEGLYVLMKQR